LLQDLLPLLRTLCALRWQPALTTLFARMAEQQQNAPRLLSELFTAPHEAEAAQVQLAAVQYATGLVEHQAAAAARATNGKKAAVQQAAGGPRLAAAAAVGWAWRLPGLFCYFS
jgi:hypothetical protein